MGDLKQKPAPSWARRCRINNILALLNKVSIGARWRPNDIIDMSDNELSLLEYSVAEELVNLSERLRKQHPEESRYLLNLLEDFAEHRKDPTKILSGFHETEEEYQIEKATRKRMRDFFQSVFKDKGGGL
jgi:hypothetical protein